MPQARVARPTRSGPCISDLVSSSEAKRGSATGRTVSARATSLFPARSFKRSRRGMAARPATLPPLAQLPRESLASKTHRLIFFHPRPHRNAHTAHRHHFFLHELAIARAVRCSAAHAWCAPAAPRARNPCSPLTPAAAQLAPPSTASDTRLRFSRSSPVGRRPRRASCRRLQARRPRAPARDPRHSGQMARPLRLALRAGRGLSLIHISEPTRPY